MFGLSNHLNLFNTAILATNEAPEERYLFMTKDTILNQANLSSQLKFKMLHSVDAVVEKRLQKKHNEDYLNWREELINFGVSDKLVDKYVDVKLKHNYI